MSMDQFFENRFSSAALVVITHDAPVFLESASLRLSQARSKPTVVRHWVNILRLPFSLGLTQFFQSHAFFRL